MKSAKTFAESGAVVAECRVRAESGHVDGIFAGQMGMYAALTDKKQLQVFWPSEDLSQEGDEDDMDSRGDEDSIPNEKPDITMQQ